MCGALDALLARSGRLVEPAAAHDRAVGPEGDRRHHPAGVCAAALRARVRRSFTRSCICRSSGWSSALSRRACRIGYVRDVRSNADAQVRGAVSGGDRPARARAARRPRAHDRAVDGRRGDCRSRSGRSSRLLFDQQNFGMPLPQALKNFAERIPSSMRGSS